MSPSFHFSAPDHFTAGAVGPPGQRVFYLQAREDRAVLTLGCEKEHVRGLGEYLVRLLARRPAPAADRASGPSLLEPFEAAWAVGTVAAGYDPAEDRILIVARELVEEDRAAEAAEVRFRITRSQAGAFVEQARALMEAGRLLCPVCATPEDPAGHLCPRRNGQPAR